MPNDAPATTTHAHAAPLDACLEFINTVELTDGRPDDSLVTARDAVAFLADRGLAHKQDLVRQAHQDGPPWLTRVRDARQALREVWDAQVEGRAPAVEALATLNALLDGGPRTELRPGPNGIEVAHRHSTDDPTGEALARLASPLVDVIASGATDRLRICANDGCRWVFEDTSRAGRRRWCDMTTCGNRAKAQRFRSKARDPKAAEPASPSGET